MTDQHDDEQTKIAETDRQKREEEERERQKLYENAVTDAFERGPPQTGDEEIDIKNEILASRRRVRLYEQAKNLGYYSPLYLPEEEKAKILEEERARTPEEIELIQTAREKREHEEEARKAANRVAAFLAEFDRRREEAEKDKGKTRTRSKDF